jgi:NADH dehydrogenase/NADH:ubiquinone oxidoreductase subunit G
VKTLNIKVNGIALTVDEGTSILEAAKKVNVKIPTLCYHPDLPAWAA